LWVLACGVLALYDAGLGFDFRSADRDPVDARCGTPCFFANGFRGLDPVFYRRRSESARSD
jgi:hypothetical protein